MPDYSAGIEISYNNLTYTTPSKGYFYIWLFGGTGGGINNIKINNISVFFPSSRVSSGEYKCFLSYLLDKNDIITWSDANLNQKFYFYPLIGVENA